ncbi:Sporulation related domain-containing protein [Pseudarcicella hirudinis]|uniref:Sporulation related domain-containing protein n=1 Tax=Pseudarcicella hirudinis TaxID=1079859 RepID=A0A1I5YEK2_9BACT|nr:SPOR domain-containing protein [Pseudarcicella hirudinis]SFQ42622.1 Sporulation related domain-containing protein [Pseudarcicella hirudinis]
MQRISYFVLFLMVIFGVACSPKVATTGKSTASATTKSTPKSNDQNLAVYRPKYNEKPGESVSGKADPKKVNKSEQPMQVNKKLDAVLDTIASRNKNIRFANGYRIQIYVGNDKKSADDAKVFTYQSFPELNPYISYTQPVFKVKVGDFLNRMDAERYFSKIKESYPTAMILPDKVEIRKGLQVK